MASSALQEQVYENKFIAYVNERTKLALEARKKGKKFYRKPKASVSKANTLEELQREFTCEELIVWRGKENASTENNILRNRQRHRME